MPYPSVTRARLHMYVCIELDFTLLLYLGHVNIQGFFLQENFRFIYQLYKEYPRLCTSHCKLQMS